MKTKLLPLSLLLASSLCFASDVNNWNFEKKCTVFINGEYLKNVNVSAISSGIKPFSSEYLTNVTINSEIYSIDTKTNFFKLALVASLLRKQVNVCFYGDEIKGIELDSVAHLD